MNAIKTLKSVALLAFALSTLFQCSSSKSVTITSFEESLPFKVKSVYFQEWYAGIEHGGTGYTLYLPIVQKKENVSIDDVYFRNLRGRFTYQDGRYIAMIKNPNKHYVFNKPAKPENYPFDLTDNECVITYSQGGITKYHKLTMNKELAGAYYKNGAPSMYKRVERSGLAALDDEDN